MLDRNTQVPDNLQRLGSLQLKSTAKLREVLKIALKFNCLASKERALAIEYISGKDGEPIPYQLLKSASTKCRTAGSETVWLHQAVNGSDLFLPKPCPREKSDELKARLAKLQESLERKQYAELVEDVTGRERREQERVYLGTYRDQLGFGLHVLAIMFTGYMAGHYAFRHLFADQPALHAAGGVLGLIAGMLVESILFIIRAARCDEEVSEGSTSIGVSNKARYLGSASHLQSRDKDSGSPMNRSISISEPHSRRRRVL